MRKTLALIALAALAACAPLPDRLALPNPPAQIQLQPAVNSVLVRDVSLPSYAAAEEIARETASGLIISSDILWADDPQRASTLAIADHLGQILGIDAGPAPWPYLGLPDVSVDIRIARMIAAADGQFHLRGAAFIGADGRAFADSHIRFDIRSPLASNTLPAIAAAQADALRQLAQMIAEKLARPSSE